MRDGQFEWDDRKAAFNAKEHRVTFELARLAFADPRAIDRLDLDETEEDAAHRARERRSDHCVLCGAGHPYPHHLGPKGNAT